MRGTRSKLGGHFAGDGMEHDDYSGREDNWENRTIRGFEVRMPTPKDEWEKMSGPVIPRRLEDLAAAHEGTDRPQIFPDVQIGKRLDGSPYYAKDLAEELYNRTGWRQWADMDPVAQAFIRLFNGDKLPHE